MKKVLIVDDAPAIRRRVAALLNASPQIRVTGEAGSAREAVEAVARNQFDAVVLDIRLPDQNGMILLKRFKADRPQMRVIMLTNLDGPRYRRACSELGADGFLNKADQFERIVEVVTATAGAPDSRAPATERSKP